MRCGNERHRVEDSRTARRKRGLEERPLKVGKHCAEGIGYLPRMSPARREEWLLATAQGCERLARSAAEPGVAESVHATGGASSMLQLATCISNMTVVEVLVGAVAKLAAASSAITQNVAQAPSTASFFRHMAAQANSNGLSHAFCASQSHPPPWISEPF